MGQEYVKSRRKTLNQTFCGRKWPVWESEIQAENFADMGENRGENLAKLFTDFRPAIFRKSGRKKFHIKKSLTTSTSHETKFFHCESLGAWGHKDPLLDPKIPPKKFI